MRNLTCHIVEGDAANHQLHVTVMDEPGSGGACHEYEIQGMLGGRSCAINFQNGPIKVVGVNGVTHEALLAILIDRLAGFQRGPFASADNGVALAALESALFALQKRTRERIARGVEGTHQK